MGYVNYLLKVCLWAISVSTWVGHPLISQTCCSGGVPLSGNIGFEGSNRGTLQMELGYDLNYISTLKEEAETLEDESRLRTTQSIKSRSVMKWNAILGAAMIAGSLCGCETETGGIEPSGNNSNNGTGSNKGWLIPKTEVFDGGPGKDGIPALTEPDFIPAGEADYISENDLVLGFVIGCDAWAYPHSFLDWLEILNDRLGDVNISVTYCPLTGTGIGWNRTINGKVTTFGVSGLLYNSNLIPYNRESDSNWSQIRLDCVNGDLIGTRVETFPLVETTWRTWKEMYPATKVVSTKTGHSRNYGYYPYGDYRTDHNYLIFPVANKDNRLENKTRVHGIIHSGNARIYPLTTFGDEVTVIQDQHFGEEFVLVGNGEDGFAVSFLRNPGDGSQLSFSAVQDRYPVVMTDNEGTEWDLFGQAVSGPREGSRLTHARSFVGYWFSFAAFYPNLSVFGEL